VDGFEQFLRLRPESWSWADSLRSVGTEKENK